MTATATNVHDHVHTILTTSSSSMSSAERVHTLAVASLTAFTPVTQVRQFNSAAIEPVT